MDYNILLDLATDLGYELAMCGAETFRVEESVSRVLSSYGIASEVFAIPNYLIVTVMMEDGTPITRMRRIGNHGKAEPLPVDPLQDCLPQFDLIVRKYDCVHTMPSVFLVTTYYYIGKPPSFQHKKIRR